MIIHDSLLRRVHGNEFDLVSDSIISIGGMVASLDAKMRTIQYLYIRLCDWSYIYTLIAFGLLLVEKLITNIPQYIGCTNSASAPVSFIFHVKHSLDYLDCQGPLF